MLMPFSALVYGRLMPFTLINRLFCLATFSPFQFRQSLSVCPSILLLTRRRSVLLYCFITLTFHNMFYYFISLTICSQNATTLKYMFHKISVFVVILLLARCLCHGSRCIQLLGIVSMLVSLY